MRNLLFLMFVPIFLLACSTTGTGAGFQAIEDLSQENFDRLLIYVNAGTKFGVGQLFDRGIVDQEDVWIFNAVARTLREVAENPASDSVATVLSTAASHVKELREYAHREYIIAILRVAETIIQARGGLTVIENDDGSWSFSDRSKALILAVSTGIEAAIAMVPSAENGLSESTISPEENALEGFRRAESGERLLR